MRLASLHALQTDAQSISSSNDDSNPTLPVRKTVTQLVNLSMSNGNPELEHAYHLQQLHASSGFHDVEDDELSGWSVSSHGSTNLKVPRCVDLEAAALGMIAAQLLQPRRVKLSTRTSRKGKTATKPEPALCKKKRAKSASLKSGMPKKAAAMK